MFKQKKVLELPDRPRILVMRYRFIGDTLLTIPFLRHLRAAYPSAMIDVLVGPNSGEVLTHCPYINHLIYFDTTRKHRYENPNNAHQGPQAFWSYVKQLRHSHYDAAFILKRSWSSAFLAFLAGIPQRIGFDTEARGWLLTHRVPYPKTGHEVDRFLSVLTHCGLLTADHAPSRHLEAWLSEQDRQTATRLLEAHHDKQNIVLHLSSSNPAKQWPLHAASEVITRLIQEHNHAIVFHCLGAAQDTALYAPLQQQFGEALQIHCGQLSLLESMAVLEQSDFVIGVDSGTLHMAAAVGTPVLSLFGPMDETQWAPLPHPHLKHPHLILHETLPCRPCNLKTPCQREFECMTALSSEKVIDGCKTFLNA